MKPRLLRSGLTGAVYVVTRYKQDGNRFEAQTKHDVTEDFHNMVQSFAGDLWNAAHNVFSYLDPEDPDQYILMLNLQESINDYEKGVGMLPSFPVLGPVEGLPNA